MNEASVVICAYTMDRWQEAVASVHAQTRPAREIIVVIDRNEELYARAASEVKGVHVVSNTRTAGLSGGRETGTAPVTAPIVAFLDDDTVADPCWLQELLPAFDDPKVLGAGGLADPKWRGPPPNWFPPDFYWVIGFTHDWINNKDGQVRNPVGANMSIRTEVLRRSSGFASTMGRLGTGTRVSGSAEETEFCIRAKCLYPGHYWALRPGARVQHVVTSSRATWRYFIRRCIIEGTAKAQLTDLVGTGDGLSSERRYLLSVLPRAFLRACGLFLRGDQSAAGRAGAIVAGVAVTGWAYAKTRAWLLLRRSNHPKPKFSEA
jgi:glycosyltransferase involved in cell wall biosynthesis